MARIKKQVLNPAELQGTSMSLPLSIPPFNQPGNIMAFLYLSAASAILLCYREACIPHFQYYPSYPPSFPIPPLINLCNRRSIIFGHLLQKLQKCCGASFCWLIVVENVDTFGPPGGNRLLAYLSVIVCAFV